jgi:hypothetical protein
MLFLGGGLTVWWLIDLATGRMSVRGPRRFIDRETDPRRYWVGMAFWAAFNLGLGAEGTREVWFAPHQAQQASPPSTSTGTDVGPDREPPR